MSQRGFYYELVNANNSSIINDDILKTPHTKRHSQTKKRRESVRSNQSNGYNEDTEDELDIEEEKVEEIEITDEDKKKVSLMYLLKLNAREWPYILTGIISSFVVGASFPIFAILFGEMYGILSDENPEDVQRQANFYSILFLVLGLATGIGTFMQTYMFNYAGVRLTSRLRSMTFKSMMSQEMGWFDDGRNAIGALCARLASDCSGVQGITFYQIPTFLNIFENFVFSRRYW